MLHHNWKTGLCFQNSRHEETCLKGWTTKNPWVLSLKLSILCMCVDLASFLSVEGLADDGVDMTMTTGRFSVGLTCKDNYDPRLGSWREAWGQEPRAKSQETGAGGQEGPCCDLKLSWPQGGREEADLEMEWREHDKECQWEIVCVKVGSCSSSGPKMTCLNFSQKMNK